MDKKLKSLLKKEELEHLLPVFADQGITDSILGDLSDGDLRDLGIDKLGERKRLLAAFQGAIGGDSSPGAMVEVEGGTLPEASELAGAKVASFEIGKFAVTMEEWQGVRSWAVANGFGFEVGEADGPKHPVTMVNWYDCVKWCNAKSLMEGLEPVYGEKGQERYYSRGEFGNDGSDHVVLKSRANGYRLPMEAEWEWTARGGKNGRGFAFAGSNKLDAVGWYGENSGGAAHAVGEKTVNELGIHDLCGNAWEWCWDLHDSSNRSIRGGGWHCPAEHCVVGYRFYYGPDYRNAFFGLRLARNLGK